MLEIVAAGSTKRRRDFVQTYVGFDDIDGGIPVGSKSSAAILFSGINGYLTSNGEQVGSENNSKDSQLIRTSDTPSGFKVWSFPGGIASVQGAGGFCLVSGEIYVVIETTYCEQPISLVQAGKIPHACLREDLEPTH